MSDVVRVTLFTTSGGRDQCPERPEDRKGLKGWAMGKAMARAGAAVPSANRITSLRDADGDGVAEIRLVFLQDSSHLSAWRWWAMISTKLLLGSVKILCAHVPSSPHSTRPALIA